MENIAEYIAYFKSLATAHADINDFTYGNSEEILSRQRSELAYPVLWLETPDISFDFVDENFEIIFTGALVILTNAALDDWDEQQKILVDNFNICQSIAYLLIGEANDDEGEFDLDMRSIRMDEVSTATNDNDWGWRLEFKISKSINPC